MSTTTPDAVKTKGNQSGWIIRKCEAGFVLKPAEPLDNRRWYFDTKQQAHEHAEYLDRQTLLEP